MNYIVIDFEYNQPFNFRKNEKGPVVGDCPFEIIQVGAVKLDSDFNIINELNFYVKTQVYKRIHPFVEKITHISAKTLKDAKKFNEVYDLFVGFIDKDSILCFWGDNDLKEIFRNAKYYKLNYNTLPNKFIDIQSLASNYLKYPLGKSIGLKNAIEALELESDLDYHNALNDAVYTARVFKIVKKEKMRREVINIKFLNKKNKTKVYKIDSGLLYKEAERDFGRQLTKKEKKIIKKFYELGKLGSFDNKNL